MHNRLAAFVPVLALVLLLCACGGKAAESPALEIVCLDVGQGNSTLLRTGAGDVLIDAGPEAAQEALVRRLHALGVESLALVILTHPDEDHIGGADGVLREFPAGRVWTNGVSEANESSQRLDYALLRAGLTPETVGTGSAVQLGAAVLTVLCPAAGQAEAGNEGSLVLRVQCGSFAMLLMGDAGAGTEAWLLEQYGPLQLEADVLHVGHHGSDAACGAEFLRAVLPECAVISCGAGNSYGHPDGRALARLEDAGASVRRTDLEGELRILTDGDTYRIAGAAG